MEKISQELEGLIEAELMIEALKYEGRVTDALREEV